MRLAGVLLTLFAVIASAQSSTVYGHKQIAAFLYADLASLKDVHMNDNLSFILECRPHRDSKAERPEVCRPSDRVAADLALVPGHPFPAPAFSFNLVKFLAGRELEPAALSLLTSALVDAVAIANQSAEARVPVSDSSEFRDSAIRAYVALEALGVNRDRAMLLIGNFVRNAGKLSQAREFVPIPPARPE